jgi:hypothetical protein
MAISPLVTHFFYDIATPLSIKTVNLVVFNFSSKERFGAAFEIGLFWTFGPD